MNDELRKIVEDHERRIATLEARLSPATAALDEVEGKDPLGGLFDNLSKEIDELEF